MGDPAGIGPEVTLKSLAEKEIQRACSPLVIGDGKVIARALEVTGMPLSLHSVKKIEGADFPRGKVGLLDLDNVNVERLQMGKISSPSGRAAYEYIEKAVELAGKGFLSAITTAPLNKAALHKAGINYPGHTEILAKLTGTRQYAMMLVGGNLRIVLLTIHLPLKKALRFLSRERILEKIKLTDKALKKSFAIEKPSIAVAGLNPHGGEGGLFGEEEEKRIRPAVEEAGRKGIKVEGPLPPDTVFRRAKEGEFDAVIAMYHDQGLIPLKMIAFHEGVNLTIGLPIIRTSPDHGTAFDIAGKGIADPGSMTEAIKLAARLARNK